MIIEKKILNYRVSVVTPTYNRADKIHRVFESLKAQTYHNFEWIVLDDGSTDNTEEIIENYRKLSPFFPIIYHRKPNTGVVNTLGSSLPFIQGDFVLKCDSDDSYTPDMIEVLLNTWVSIPDAEKPFFRAVSSPVMDQDHHFFGKPLGFPFLDTTYLDMEHKYKRREERLWLERADLWQQFDFSEGVGDHLIWYPKIIRDYKIRCIDKPLRIYYRGESGGLTTQMTKRMAYSRFTSACATFNWEMDYFWVDTLAFLWRTSNVWLNGYALGYNLKKTAHFVHNFWGKSLLWFCLPLGLWRISRAKQAGLRWQ